MLNTAGFKNVDLLQERVKHRAGCPLDDIAIGLKLLAEALQVRNILAIRGERVSIDCREKPWRR